MELVKVLRELSRRRKLVAVVLAFSLLVGLLMAFRPGLPPHSRQYNVSLASADILIDTRDSQVVSVTGHSPGLLTLASRANLLGNLMTGGPLKDAIARQAGVDPELLVVIPPGAGTPSAPVETPAARQLSDAESTVLSLSTDETLPILHVVAQAPNQETARRLSAGTIVELQKYLGSVAASQRIPAVQQLVVREFGAPVTGSARRGLPRRDALLTALALAVLGCASIIGVTWFRRSWKQAEEAELLDPTPGGDAPEDGDGDGAKPTDSPNGLARSPGPHGQAVLFPR